MAQVEMLIQKDIQNTRGASKREYPEQFSSRLPRGEAARRVCRSLTSRSSSTVATGRDREAGGEVDGIGGKADVARKEDDVVVGVGDARREEARPREAVGGEVGAARRHWWTGLCLLLRLCLFLF
jgi:hypothetical protein